MLAWQVREYGAFAEVLERSEIDAPQAPESGVVVEVAAAGLNFFDILSIAGEYQIKVPPPFVPGSEAAGRVVEVGPKSRWSIGDRVIASNIAGACGTRMAVLDSGCFEVPDRMTDAHAAAFLIIYQTAYFALRHRAAVQPGETVLVHGGAGGVGTASIQVAKALGAKVIATASTAEKLEVCRRCGADEVINYRDDDFVSVVKKQTAGKGVDVVIDPVGGDVFDRSTKCIAWEGRLVVIGFAEGRIPEIRANRILLKNISVTGLNWGGYQLRNPAKILSAHQSLLEWYAAGKLEPVIYGDFGAADLPVALDSIAQRQSYGKVVLQS